MVRLPRTGFTRGHTMSRTYFWVILVPAYVDGLWIALFGYRPRG